MNLHKKLLERQAAGRPIRVGLIGAGKFGAMFLAQARTTAGMHVAAIADLSVERARDACRRTGWAMERLEARSVAEAIRTGGTCITDDTMGMIASDGMEVIIEATGHPPAGISHALAAIAHRRHIVMVTVEADVVAGPLLAKKAAEAGVVYSLAYGDQPAEICELVDWARAAGFKVVCAGKGTKYHPDFHASTPQTVWENFGWDARTVAESGGNPKMFNSFIDGTKSGIEMAAVCNATGLSAPLDGLGFPACKADDIAKICKPAAQGGTLQGEGMVEVISSLNRDRSPVPNHLQMGVYVTIEGDTDYVRRCFKEYWMLPDDSLRYAGLYRPIHMIGLELGISVASAALRNEATGAPTGWRADVVATAKRDLAAGEMLDGEGGYMVWGKIMPASESLRRNGLPLGLAHNIALTRGVKQGQIVTWADVKYDANDATIRFRREMEQAFAPSRAAAE